MMAGGALDRLVVLGGGAVGKSSLTLRFVSGNFVDGVHDPTIEDTYRQTIEVDGEVSTAEVVDTAGQQEFRVLLGSWITSCEAVVIVYSVTSRESLEEAEEFYKQVQRRREGEDLPIVLVGNKCDLEEQRVVSKKEGEQLAQSWTNATWMEASAKTPVNDIELFEEAVRRCRKHKSGGIQDTPAKRSLKSRLRNGPCLIM
ncbi:MAG: hypothetical protein MHM6MM_006536 [Cercozoa sp. M6MM]